MECDYVGCYYSSTSQRAFTWKLKEGPAVHLVGRKSGQGFVDLGCGCTLVWEDWVRVNNLDQHLPVHISRIHGDKSTELQQKSTWKFRVGELGCMPQWSRVHYGQ